MPECLDAGALMIYHPQEVGARYALTFTVERITVKNLAAEAAARALAANAGPKGRKGRGGNGAQDPAAAEFIERQKMKNGKLAGLFAQASLYT